MGEEIIDINEVLERVEGDRELLVELIEIFLEDYPGRMENLKKAFEEKDYTQVKDAAHSLKGAAANISAKRISTLFLDIENMAQNSDLSKIEEFYNKFNGYIKELEDFLAKMKEGSKDS